MSESFNEFERKCEIILQMMETKEVKFALTKLCFMPAFFRLFNLFYNINHDFIWMYYMGLLLIACLLFDIYMVYLEIEDEIFEDEVI